MDLFIDDIIDIEENDNEVAIRVPKRYVRDFQNPFEYYNERNFKKRYRFDKNSVMYRILTEIEAGLTKVNRRGLPIPPVFQLLVCLRFYATASYQLVNADLLGISQSTVSRIVFRVTQLIVSLFTLYIRMPTTANAQTENRRLFTQLGFGQGAIGIPGVDGVIDCTHIRLQHTRFQNYDEAFRNRKGYFSLNVQTVVGPRMEILDIVPEWPGSTHDSRIFQNSRIYMRYAQGELNGFLVGDAGYPCFPFLMTPLANPITNEEIRYNNIQSRTRTIVERVYGVLKRRLPCLYRGLTTHLYTSTGIIIACAVLHNMALIYNDVLPEDEFLMEEEVVPAAEPDWQHFDGFAFREALIARMFH